MISNMSTSKKTTHRVNTSSSREAQPQEEPRKAKKWRGGSVLSMIGWILIIILLLIWIWCWWSNSRRRPCWLCGTSSLTFSRPVDSALVTCNDEIQIDRSPVASMSTDFIATSSTLSTRTR
jgi:hypothetical protein